MSEQGTAANVSIGGWGRASFLSQLGLKPRIMLFFFTPPVVLVAFAVSGIGVFSRSTTLMLAGTFIWALLLGLMLMIAMPATDRLLQNQTGWLSRGALTIFIAVFIFGILAVVAVLTMGSWFHPADNPEGVLTKALVSLEHGFAYNDATALCHQAAENLLSGKNPYANANVVKAMLEFGGFPDKVTKLREGKFANMFPRPDSRQAEQLWDEAIRHPEQIPVEFESKVCYPAGCFLIPAPFLLMGITDLRIVYLIFVLAALAWVIWFIPGKMKLVFAGAALISLELWKGIANGENGVLCFALLLIAWALVKRQLWVSAIFMGLAVATKQIAWLFLPFYLIMLLREIGLKKVVRVTAIIGGMFLAINAPFVVADPELWFTSIMAPMMDNLFPSGVGIVTLVTGGILNIQSSLVFGAIETAVFILAIVWYFRYYHHHPQAGPILAVLPLFFAWRSLKCYFFYTGLIMLAGMMINEYSAEEPRAVG